MSRSDIPGKWQMTASENFDAFMAAVGVGYLTRKVHRFLSFPIRFFKIDFSNSYSFDCKLYICINKFFCFVIIKSPKIRA